MASLFGRYGGAMKGMVLFGVMVIIFIMSLLMVLCSQKVIIALASCQQFIAYLDSLSTY